jgi:hypothetical protein
MNKVAILFATSKVAEVWAYKITQLTTEFRVITSLNKLKGNSLVFVFDRPHQSALALKTAAHI